MGYDFLSVEANTETGEHDHYYLNIHGWGMVFDLAVSNGWEPVGTLLQRYEWNEDAGEGDYAEDADGNRLYYGEDEWQGSYFSNDGQEITKEDGIAFADALEWWLKEVPLSEKIEDGWSEDAWWLKEGCQKAIDYFRNSSPVRIH